MEVKTGYFYEKASPFLTRFVISCIVLIIICLIYISINIIEMQEDFTSPTFYKTVEKN